MLYVTTARAEIVLKALSAYFKLASELEKEVMITLIGEVAAATITREIEITEFRRRRLN